MRLKCGDANSLAAVPRFNPLPTRGREPEKIWRASRRPQLCLDPPHRLFHLADLIADDHLAVRANQLVELLLRRYDRAMAPPAKIVADFTKRRPGVPAGQPHGEHPRLGDRARFALRLETRSLDAEHVAHSSLN